MRMMVVALAVAMLATPMAADAALCRNKKTGTLQVKPVCAKKNVPALSTDLGVVDPDGGLEAGNAGIGIADGGVTTDRLAPGAVTPGKVGVVPAARVSSSVPINIPGAAEPIALTFNLERFDTADVHGSSNPSRLTAPLDGIYVISANVSWAGTNASGAREITIRRNTTAIILRDVVQPVAGGNTTEQAVSTIAALEQGDFVEVVVRQNSGDALQINAAEEFSPEFSLAYVGLLPIP
ncbi:MAG TPA: hypothetical protein VGR62_13010 [Candidatus Binatia bacterium]|jgi:hypothetical protein|nr:hypothetical protein [Candidatus Binatia bacterium]